MQLSTLNFAIALVYWIDYAFSSHSSSYAWRVPCALQCVLLFPMLVLVFLIDETPRWLVSHDRADEALEVLLRLKSHNLSQEAIRELHADIVNTVRVEKAIGAGSWRDLLHNDSIQSQRRLMIACGIQMMQQLGGINSIVYFSGTLFHDSVGLSSHMSALMSGFLQTWFFLASFIPWLLIDRVGRRSLLISMISLMACVFIVQTGLIKQVQEKTSIAHTAGIGATAMLFVYEGAFTVGFQATVWVYPTEILPLRLRQKGSSISTASNWIMNFLIVKITPLAIANIGYKTYIIFAVLNSLWVPIIYFFFPETKGMLPFPPSCFNFSKLDD
jgi:sugar porter (SP) family MFS transporter